MVIVIVAVTVIMFVVIVIAAVIAFMIVIIIRSIMNRLRQIVITARISRKIQINKTFRQINSRTKRSQQLPVTALTPILYLLLLKHLSITEKYTHREIRAE